MTSPGNNKIDLRELRELSAGDNHFFEDMINTFIRTTQEGLGHIRIALARKNWDAVSDQAHKMRGPCSHLGMNELKQLLTEIEKNAALPDEQVTIARLLDEAEAEAGFLIRLLREEISA